MAAFLVLSVIGLLLFLYLRNPELSSNNSDPNKPSSLLRDISESESLSNHQGSNNHNI